MTTIKNFSELAKIVSVSNVSTTINNNKEESIMTYSKENNYGVSAEIVNQLMAKNVQMEMDNEVIAYGEWFLNRPVVRTVVGEVINYAVIKEAKKLIGSAKMEMKMMNDAKIKQTKK